MQVGFAQFIPCSIIIDSLRYPQFAQAGQTVQVLTTVTSSCYPSTPYAVRVDLLEGTSLSPLSSITIPYDPTMPGLVAYPVTSNVTAPLSLGPWVLQLHAYVIAVLSGEVAASTSYQFNINVIPYTPPSTTTATTNPTTQLTTIATSLVQTSTSSTLTSPVIVLNSTSTFSPPAPAITQNTSMTGTLLVVAAVVAVLVGAIIVFAIERHGNSTASKTGKRANYCANCGTKLRGNDAFCSNCGTPLKLQRSE